MHGMCVCVCVCVRTCVWHINIMYFYTHTNAHAYKKLLICSRYVKTNKVRIIRARGLCSVFSTYPAGQTCCLFLPVRSSSFCDKLLYLLSLAVLACSYQLVSECLLACVSTILRVRV